MLASAPPRRIAISPVADRRMETTRIGSRPKGKGDILTSRPVPTIVREAIVVEVSKNGHSVRSDAADVVLTAAVETFWLDIIIGGDSSTQYVGRVVIALMVADGHRGDSLLTRRYIGIKRQQVSKAWEGAWRDVMDAALARAMHDFATDPDLVAILSRAPTATPGERATGQSVLPGNRSGRGRQPTCESWRSASEVSGEPPHSEGARGSCVQPGGANPETPLTPRVAKRPSSFCPSAC
jgi:hypothetical protein